MHIQFDTFGGVTERKPFSNDKLTNISNIYQNDTLEDYTKFPALNKCPTVGDRIAFKILEMDENYCPELSEYKRARVLDVMDNGQVTLELQNVKKKIMNGKFEVGDSDAHENIVNYVWTDLRELRLIESK